VKFREFRVYRWDPKKISIAEKISAEFSFSPSRARLRATSQKSCLAASSSLPKSLNPPRIFLPTQTSRPTLAPPKLPPCQIPITTSTTLPPLLDYLSLISSSCWLLVVLAEAAWPCKTTGRSRASRAKLAAVGWVMVCFLRRHSLDKSGSQNGRSSNQQAPCPPPILPSSLPSLELPVDLQPSDLGT
jgi:hypothetical protein